MFDISSTPWDAHEKVSAFIPKYIVGTVVPDQYFSGTWHDIDVDIVENSDGNILITLPFIMGVGLHYDVGDLIYFLSGAYKGYNKVYRKTSTTIECLTPWTTDETGINIHCVRINSFVLGWDPIPYLGSSESVKIDPIIKTTDNSYSFDITAYLQSAFGEFIIPVTATRDACTSTALRLDNLAAALEGLCLYASTDPALFNPKVDAAGVYDHPMVDAHVIFTAYHCALPFIKNDGIYNLLGTGSAIQTYLSTHSTRPTNFFYSALCDPNAVNIFFINKFGGWQNFVCIGAATYGRDIANPQELVTAYPIKRRISDPGKIYKSVKVTATGIAHALLPLITAMIESPVTMVYDEDAATYTECIILKKSFDYWNTNDKTITVSFEMLMSELIYTQQR